VVYGIVKDCGGTVTVYSESGAGSVFNVYLPALVEGAQSIAEQMEPIPTGTERILFVDDERVLVELARTMLAALGYTVTALTDSIEALKIFRERKDSFDLVITDLTMPGITGIELSRAILQIRPNIPIILCTGYTEIVTEEEVKQTGIRKFVMKPLNTKDIARLIRRVLVKGDS
jgi:two-component system, cell cycle sensor histidine kinase and response regulator CckA